MHLILKALLIGEMTLRFYFSVYEYAISVTLCGQAQDLGGIQKPSLKATVNLQCLHTQSIHGSLLSPALFCNMQPVTA